MIDALRALSLLLVFALSIAAAPVMAQKAAEAQRADRYLCPNATSGGVDCFLEAVSHLYTMCRQVKSIEIIEFGYEKSAEGVNGAKSEYCIEKHQHSIARPYQTALREAARVPAAVDGLKALHLLWTASLTSLNWTPGEDDNEYKTRVAGPYAVFGERADAIRAALAAGKAKPAKSTKPAAKSTKPAVNSKSGS